MQLLSRVPQGGILSPTLYIMYTKDVPVPQNDNNLNVIFADDITQVIQNKENDKQQLAIDTAIEIERINQYERKWKIQTNMTKFNILSISKLRPEPIEIQGRIIPFANEAKTLGLTLKRTDTLMHVNNRIGMAKQQSLKIKRFAKLSEKNKLYLYKALIRPLLEYPIIPNGRTAETNIKKFR